MIWPATKQNTASAELSARGPDQTMLTKERAQQAPEGEAKDRRHMCRSNKLPRPVACCCCILDTAQEVLHHSANVHVDICMRLSHPSVLLGERFSSILHVIFCAIPSSCAASGGLRGHKSFTRRNNVHSPPPHSPETLYQREHTLVPCHGDLYQARTQLLTFRASHSNCKKSQL